MTRPRLIRALVLALGLTLAGCPPSSPPAHGAHDDHDDHDAGQDAGQDEHEGSSDVVRLTTEQLAGAGVTVTTASLGSSAATLRLTAVVTPDRDAQLHVTPKVPGVVRSITGQLGARVAKGDVLCELDSVELGQAVAEWVKARLLLESQRGILAQEEGLLERRVELSRAALAREDKLRGQEIGTVRAYYAAEQALAEAQLDRDRRLVELRATASQLGVQVAAARSRLAILGLSDADLAPVASGQDALSGRDLGRVLVRAAAPGVVVDRHLTLGEHVDTSDVLFEVHDLSRVWVEARVFEKDLRTVRTGQRACVRLDALPGTHFDATVALVGASLDRESRAAIVRIVLENPTDTSVWHEPFPIRPGMFGAVELVQEERPALVLAESAVVHEGPSTFVFVREAEDAQGAAFRRRPVQVRDAGEGRVEVVSGLEAGAVVAATGLFTLKSVARQGELGGGHSH